MANVLIISIIVLFSPNILLKFVESKDVSAIRDKYDENKVDNYTQDEKDAILAKHNEFRSGVSPTAMNMEYMEWNEDLATIAGLWASVCYWGHGTPDIELLSEFEGSVSQNIWYGTTKPNGLNAVNAWHKEVNHYTYATNTCAKKPCGHYKQVVWAKSRQVGCGRAFCPALIDIDGNPTGVKNIWLYACQYWPRGNAKKTKPYIAGPSCGGCPDHARLCYQNMCTNCTTLLQHEPSATCECKRLCNNCGSVNSECACDCVGGWYGDDCSKVCEDWHKGCNKSPGFPNKSSCGKFPSIPNKCPVMCEVCSPVNECEL